MATESEILAARRQRAEQLRERGVELFPARVPRPLARIPELIAEHGERSGEELEAEQTRMPEGTEGLEISSDPLDQSPGFEPPPPAEEPPLSSRDSLFDDLPEDLMGPEDEPKL